MNELDIVPFRLLLDRTVAIARRHWRPMVAPVMLPLVVSGIFLTVVQIIWLESFTSLEQRFPVAQFVALVLVAGAGVAIYTMAFWVVAVGSARAAIGEPMNLWRVWLWVFRPRIFGTLAVALVLGLASLLFCLAPALYVLPMLSFVVPVMVNEGRTGLAALRRSHELAGFNPTTSLRHNCWLQIVVLAAVGMVLNYSLALSLQMPLVVVQQVIAVRDALAGSSASELGSMSGGSMWLQLPINLIGALVTAASWMFWTFGIALLYGETIRRKDAADLVVAIDAMVGEQA